MCETFRKDDEVRHNRTGQPGKVAFVIDGKPYVRMEGMDGGWPVPCEPANLTLVQRTWTQDEVRDTFGDMLDL
jgi:hypothetical protein